MISGYRSGVNKVFIFLGHYAAFSDSYRRFGTAYGSHLQGLGSEDWADRLSPNVGNELAMKVV